MTLDINGITASLESHALSLGVFDRVSGHEPKNAPGNGLTAAFWVESVAPARGMSGLAATSVLLTFNCRVYTSMMTDPQDGIDPLIVGAVDLLLASYSGDFDLNGTVRNVDLLGQSGTPLSARAGYLTQDGKLFRVFTVTIPIVANDIWSQAS